MLARPIKRKGKKEMERVMGIEPTSVAWEATALPLSYTRSGHECIFVLSSKMLPSGEANEKLQFCPGVRLS
jgi:hypothetical protein